MGKKTELKKIYFPLENLQFLLEGEGYVCFGCGKTVPQKEPKFSFGKEGKEKNLCLTCALLAKKKEKQEVREKEFNPLTMASIHTKHFKEIINRLGQEKFEDVLSSIFPEFPKIRLLGGEVEEEEGK